MHFHQFILKADSSDILFFTGDVEVDPGGSYRAIRKAELPCPEQENASEADFFLILKVLISLLIRHQSEAIE